MLLGSPIGTVLGTMSLGLVSLPIVTNGLVTALRGAQPVDLATARNPDTMVILDRGIRSEAIEQGGGPSRP